MVLSFHFPVTFSYLNQYFPLSEVTITNEHSSWEMGGITSDLACNCCFLIDRYHCVLAMKKSYSPPYFLELFFGPRFTLFYFIHDKLLKDCMAEYQSSWRENS